MEKWYKSRCTNCRRNNWICAGNPHDYTAAEIEVVVCHNCGQKFWLDSSFAFDYHGSDVGEACIYETWEECLNDCKYIGKGLESPN